MFEKHPNFDNPEEMFESIHNWALEMHRRIDEREKYFEQRRKPLPEKLYHVTTRKNAQQILKEGIDPSKLILEDSEVVSLSDDIDYAMGVAEVTQNAKKGDLAVLEIDTKYLTPSRTKNYLLKADPENPDPIEGAEIHEAHYESTIPPEAIKVPRRNKDQGKY
ncbi:MAG: hypothetical protein ACOZBH_02155 [Patescibacteria group bacterium]